MMHVNGLMEGDYSTNVLSSPFAPLLSRFSQVGQEFWASPNSKGLPALLGGEEKDGREAHLSLCWIPSITHTKYTHSEPLLVK